MGLPPSASREKGSTTQGLQVWAAAERSVPAQDEQRAPRTVDGSSPMRLAIGLASTSHWKLLDWDSVFRNASERTNCSKSLNPQERLELSGFTSHALGCVTMLPGRKALEKSDLCSLQGASRKQLIVLLLDK